MMSMTAKMNESALGVLVQCDEVRTQLTATPGQLWERLAERKLDPEKVTSRIAAAYRVASWSRNGEHGPRALDHPRSLSGTIIAGRMWHQR